MSRPFSLVRLARFLLVAEYGALPNGMNGEKTQPSSRWNTYGVRCMRLELAHSLAKTKTIYASSKYIAFEVMESRSFANCFVYRLVNRIGGTGMFRRDMDYYADPG
jgi:hypothetical protein